MKIGVIADDFTGASDIALTLAEAGMSVAQFIGLPDGACDPALGAGVVALKSRTAPVEQAIAESIAACDWLLEQGCTQIIFKVCSTFDSTSKGNIGQVLDALAQRMGVSITLVSPAFPENGRSVYQGHLFVNDVLLNESGMQDHPLTPMTDADLRRVLAAQSTMSVGHIAAQIVAKGSDAIAAEMANQSGHLIVDAIQDADLMAIGEAAKSVPLLCGGSGIALGLPRNFGASDGVPAWNGIKGKGVVLSGSCSRATRTQVDNFRKTAQAVEVNVKDVISGATNPTDIADWVMAQTGAPLVYSSADPEVVKAAQKTFGQDKAAHAIEGFFADLAATLAMQGVTRMVVAGGETSGSVVSGLGAKVLGIGPRLAAGVPVCRSGDMALALKSGNFGGPDFFAEALAKMEQST
jgi:uncharacterized protein YgbK (DUF1537 family)